MITATLFNVQYQMNGPRVWLSVRTPSEVFMLESTQEALLEHAAPAVTVWGDTEALVEAQVQLDTRFPDVTYLAVLAPVEEES